MMVHVHVGIGCPNMSGNWGCVFKPYFKVIPMGLLFGWEYYVVLGQPFRGGAPIDGTSILLDCGAVLRWIWKPNGFKDGSWKKQLDSVFLGMGIEILEDMRMGILHKNAPNSIFRLRKASGHSYFEPSPWNAKQNWKVTLNFEVIYSKPFQVCPSNGLDSLFGWMLHMWAATTITVEPAPSLQMVDNYFPGAPLRLEIIGRLI